MAAEHSAARHPLGAVFDEPDLRFAGRYLDRGAVELGGEVLLCIHHRVEQVEHRGVRHGLELRADVHAGHRHVGVSMLDNRHFALADDLHFVERGVPGRFLSFRAAL